VLKLDWDTDADAVYARLSDEPVHSTRELDSQRVIDLNAAGQIVGIEFLAVHGGVDFSGMPRRDELAHYFGEHHIPIFA
jgi:uncharacterized protein YuzE